MENKLNYKLLNILIVVLIICLLYFIRGLWMGIFTKIVAIILPFLVAFVGLNGVMEIVTTTLIAPPVALAVEKAVKKFK